MEEEIVVLPIEDDDYEEEEEEEPVKKSRRGRPKKKKQVWTTELITNLIELWSAEPSLYIDTQKSKNKDMRTEAIERLRIKMFENGLKITSEEIEKKLHSLKNYYIITSNKVETSKQESEYGVYQPTWPHFESLDFLKDNITSKAFLDNTADDPVIFTEESPVRRKRGRPSKRWLREKDIYEVEDPAEAIPNQQIGDSKSNNLTTDDYFCQMLLSQLKNFESRPKKEYLKLQIQQLVYQTMFADPSVAESGTTNNASQVTMANLNGTTSFVNGH